MSAIRWCKAALFGPYALQREVVIEKLRGDPDMVRERLAAALQLPEKGARWAIKGGAIIARQGRILKSPGNTRFTGELQPAEGGFTNLHGLFVVPTGLVIGTGLAIAISWIFIASALLSPSYDWGSRLAIAAGGLAFQLAVRLYCAVLWRADARWRGRVIRRLSSFAES